jgi:cell division protein FtsB
MLEIIFAFVLALIVGLSVVVALHISRLTARVSAAELWLSTMRNDIESSVSSRLAELPKSTLKLAAEVDELRDDLDAMREAHRKFARKVWGRIGAEEARVEPKTLDRNELRRQHLPRPTNHG